MKKHIQWLTSCLFVLMTLISCFAYADTPSPSHTKPPSTEGPVFPIEDLIEKPNPATDHFLADLFNMLATLGLIVALILIAGWFLKRLATTRQQQANETSSIKVLERRSLSPKTAVYILEIEGTGILMAESVNGVTRLAEFPIAKEKSFASTLDKQTSTYDS